MKKIEKVLKEKIDQSIKLLNREKSRNVQKERRPQDYEARKVFQRDCSVCV